MKTINELVDGLKQYIASNYPDMDLPKDNVLEIEIKSAIGAINRCRRFEPKNDILYDDKYEDKIIPLAMTGVAKIGAEGQTYHGENNVVRHYSSGGKYPNDMLQDIIPLVKFW